MDQFLTNAANLGLGVACLIGAVWWLNRENQRKDAARESERKENQARENVERIAFREERDKRLLLLESEIKECREDRMHLHQKIDNLQQEHCKILRAIIEQEITGNCGAACIKPVPGQK